MPIATKHRTSNKQRPVEVRNQTPVNLHEFLLRRLHLLLFGRLFLQFDELLKNFFGHRRGRIAAMAAMLDQDGDRHLRILHRRIGNKPGVVAVELGSVVRFSRMPPFISTTWAVPVLPATSTSGDLAIAPVPRPLTTSASALCTRLSVSGLISMVRMSSGPIFTHRRAIDRFDFADHARTKKLSAVGNRRHHVGEL